MCLNALPIGLFVFHSLCDAEQVQNVCLFWPCLVAVALLAMLTWTHAVTVTGDCKVTGCLYMRPSDGLT